MQDLRIIIVEDESLIAMMVQDALQEGGFATSIVCSGEKAIALFDQQSTTFAALITDVNLGAGKLRGWDVARHARELMPDLPVVYMTGDSAAEWASQGVPSSVMISKPFASAQIVNAVAGLINAAHAST